MAGAQEAGAEAGRAAQVIDAHVLKITEESATATSTKRKNMDCPCNAAV